MVIPALHPVKVDTGSYRLTALVASIPVHLVIAGAIVLALVALNQLTFEVVYHELYFAGFAKAIAQGGIGVKGVWEGGKELGFHGDFRYFQLYIAR